MIVQSFYIGGGVSMATMIEYKGKLVRINPAKASELQFSKNRGLSWHHRGSSTPSMGNFLEIMDGGNELLATCEKGLYFSTNEGLSFHRRSR